MRRDFPFDEFESLLKEIGPHWRSTLLVPLILAFPLEGNKFGKTYLCGEACSKRNNWFIVDETVLQVPFIVREGNMLLLGWIESEAPCLIKCMVRLNRLIYVFLDLRVLLSGLLDFLAFMRIAPSPTYTHVLPISLLEDLQYRYTLEIRVALDDGGLIDNLED